MIDNNKRLTVPVDFFDEYGKIKKILLAVGDSMKLNYQKIRGNITKLQAEGKKPVLVLHCCCAPCSTYVLKYLAQYFVIKILFYNPNISPKEEYFRRLDELFSLLKQMQLEQEIEVIETEYHPGTVLSLLPVVWRMHRKVGNVAENALN